MSVSKFGGGSSILVLYCSFLVFICFRLLFVSFYILKKKICGGVVVVVFWMMIRFDIWGQW